MKWIAPFGPPFGTNVADQAMVHVTPPEIDAPARMLAVESWPKHERLPTHKVEGTDPTVANVPFAKPFTVSTFVVWLHNRGIFDSEIGVPSRKKFEILPQLGGATERRP